MFKSPIERLLLSFDSSEEYSCDQIDAVMFYVCQTVFTVFPTLKSLIVDQLKYDRCVLLSFDHNRLERFSSSNLVNLKISVEEFRDCLYLFDRRFSQLRHVHVNVDSLSLFDDANEQVHFSISTIFFKTEEISFGMICLRSNLSRSPVND